MIMHNVLWTIGILVYTPLFVWSFDCLSFDIRLVNTLFGIFTRLLLAMCLPFFIHLTVS